MNKTTSGLIGLVGRLLLALIFITGGWGKLNAMDGTVGYITSAGLPSPQLAYYVSVVVELGGGLLILAGLFTRVVALALAVFCVVTAAVFHSAWNGPDAMQNMGQMINFWKNISMAGGFLQLVAFGAGALSLDALLPWGREPATARLHA